MAGALLCAMASGCEPNTSATPADGALPGADHGIDQDAADGGPLADAAILDRGGPEDAEIVDAAQPEPRVGLLSVQVRLDGAPAPGARVSQGGAQRFELTDADGWAHLEPDLAVVGQLAVVASHPQARQRFADFDPEAVARTGEVLTVDLRAFDPVDNPAYRFADPGEPRRRNTTAQCGHCHLTINDAWFESAHREAASNPVVHDLYAGTAPAEDAESCAVRGGRWLMARQPGDDALGFRCYVGVGVLPSLNADCADGPCPTPAETGACADCHAPGMDGEIGGRDLLEARGYAHDYGVFCDVCHRVAEVVAEAPAGVAGRLRLMRPSDPGPITLGAGGFLPLTFGPSHDSPNPRMGSVQRDHYRDATICMGCHQLDVEPLVPGAAADRERWPDGRLPVQSTWAEWQAGPVSDAPCQSCHMPPEAGAANSADLQAFPAAEVGVQGGWLRPAGSVRRHQWIGPRVAPTFAALAASLKARPRLEGEVFTVEVTTRNIGAGHALPTGEPMRHLLLRVDALCGDEALPPVGGDALPGWAGALARQPAGGDWSRWPGAAVGDVIRVVARPGGFHDYLGFGPFGDGRFDAEAKGLPIEQAVGHAVVTATEGDRVVLDRPLPPGDVAYQTRGDAWAGASGFAFARNMVDGEGREMVPHFVAVDVRSDNRLLPQGRWASTHAFPAACAEPVARARLVYRAYPWWLRQERGWTPREIVLAELEVRP